MGAIFVLLGLFILILIFYLLLPSVECFTNSYSKEEIEVIINREIIVIKTAYDKIKDYYNKGFLINSVEVEKEKITDMIAKGTGLWPSNPLTWATFMPTRTPHVLPSLQIPPHGTSDGEKT